MKNSLHNDHTDAKVNRNNHKDTVKPTLRERAAGARLTLSQGAAGAVVLLVVGIGIGANTDIWNGSLRTLGLKPNVPALDFSSVEKTYESLAANFDGKIDKAKLVDGANHGLVAAAGDQYTVYFNKDEANEFNGDLNGTFSGIGAELGLRDSVVTVVSTLDGSPAKQAGLQTGDKVVGVADQSTQGWSLEKAVSQIRGKAGTSVKISVLRGDENKDFTITRADLTNPSVKGEIVDAPNGDGKIGILTLNRFGSDTVGLARTQAKQFKDAGVKGVVLDLRGNGGGLVDAAQGVAGIWLDNKTVVSEKRNGATVDTLKSGSDTILQGVKTVVLVDGGSASASEIVAGALKDNGAATLLGMKSFGKGSVQTILDLAGGSELKVTIARWYTPAGKNIDKEGITPDTIVTPTDDQINAGQDIIRDAALGQI